MTTALDVLTSPLFGLLFATFLSLFLYLRARKIKRFSYDIQSSEVIGHNQLIADELNVLFNGEPVPRVTRVLVRFWNSGHETIRGTDIAAIDPLRLDLASDSQLLASKIEIVSRQPIGISVKEARFASAPSLLIGFDFLDRGDGAIVSLLHTAPADKVALKGTIQGIPKGLRNWLVASDIDAAIRNRNARDGISRLRSFLFRYGFFIVVMLAGIFLMTGALVPELVLAYFPSLGEPDMSEVLVVGRVNKTYFFLGMLSLFISFLCVLFWWYRPPTSLTARAAS